jgi:hypothetical protein
VSGSFDNLGLADSPPHPKPSASTSPRKRGEVRKDRPHPEEARSAVSKDEATN